MISDIFPANYTLLNIVDMIAEAPFYETCRNIIGIRPYANNRLLLPHRLSPLYPTNYKAEAHASSTWSSYASITHRFESFHSRNNSRQHLNPFDLMQLSMRGSSRGGLA